MSNDGNDILMRMVKADGSPMLAECQTEVDTDYDDFVDDYFNGEFFEIKSFGLTMSISDKDPREAQGGGHAPGQVGTGLQGHSAAGAHSRSGAPTQIVGQVQGKGANAGVFSRWKLATPDEIRKMKRFPVKMDDITISRDYDKASPTLMQHVCDSRSFKSASMVKRKVIGNNMLRGFVRIEFDELLVKHVTWSNGETLQEKFTFTYRAMRYRYRATTFKEGGEGVVLKELATAKWSYDAELENRKLPVGG